MPSHHPPDEVLYGYAAGTCSPEEELLVACHLTLCPTCRSAADTAERIVAGLVPDDGPEPGEAVWSGVLARLDAPEAPAAPVPPAAAPTELVHLPAPLARVVGPYSRLPFRTTWPGMRVARLDVPGGSGARVFVADFAPGFVIPDHSHRGVERGLVLRGGFRADGDAYAVGDVSWHDGDHRDLRVDDDGPCTGLFVNDGALGLGGADWLDLALERWMLRSG